MLTCMLLQVRSIHKALILEELHDQPGILLVKLLVKAVRQSTPIQQIVAHCVHEAHV